jgi:branched-chain amino acid transport system permease protein
MIKLEGPQTIDGGKSFWATFACAIIGLAAIPSLVDLYTAIFMANVLIAGILALSLSLLWGYTGILSLGQAIFYGLGGYVYGVFALNMVDGGYSSTLLALVPGVLGPTLFALAFGAILFFAKLRGVYIAILLLVASMLLETFMVQTTDPMYTLGAAELGGANGMRGIPSLAIGLGESTYEIDGRAPVFYYFVLALLVAVYLGLRWLVNSRWGYVMVGCREDMERTEVFGYDVRLVQLVVFSISAGIAGLAGTLNAAWGAYVHPGVFAVEMNILIVIWVTVGGRRDLTAAVLGAMVLEWLNVYYLSSTDYAVLILGFILVVAMLVAPQGLYVAAVDYLKQYRKRGDKNDYHQASA